MKSVPVTGRVRCAIYTRVSTDQGLDQDFNSLDAQYEAASAYIKSQAHAGWTLIRSRAITSAIQRYITEQNSGASDRDDPIKLDHDVLATLVSRIEVQRTQLVISLKPTDRST